MGEAIGWGALAASSLVIGALLSAVSLELAAEGIEAGGAGVTGSGWGVSALTYFFLDGLIARRSATGRGHKGRSEGSGSDSGCWWR
jgi:ZIP family zinc transporter